MKQIGRICALVVVLVLGGTMSLWAQADKFEAFGEKYEDVEGCTVLSLGRSGLRMASIMADKETRQFFKKLDLMVNLTHSGGENLAIKEDFLQLVEGFEQVAAYEDESGQALLYIDSTGSAVAIYSFLDDGVQSVVLLVGDGLTLDDVAPEEATATQ